MSEDADPDCASHESLSKLGVKSSRLNLRARLARSWTGVGTDSKASAEPALYAEVRWQPQDDLSEMLQPLAGVRPWDIRSPEAVSLQGARQPMRQSRAREVRPPPRARRVHPGLSAPTCR